MMKRAAAIAVLFALPAAAARACAVCGGAIDENIVEASNTVLWTLLTLELWHRTWIDGDGARPQTWCAPARVAVGVA